MWQPPKKVKDAGKIPFYFTFKDSWTTLPMFNALASNIPGDKFMDDRTAGTTTFAQGYKEVAEKKQLKLVEFGHKDNFGKGYADGNAAFAKGESAMYLQGVWAIPEIKKKQIRTWSLAPSCSRQPMIRPRTN